MPEALSEVPLALFWVILTALIGAAIGGIGTVFYRYGRDRFSEDFVRVVKGDAVVHESDLGAFAQVAELDQFRAQFLADLNAIGGKVQGLTDLHTRAIDRIDMLDGRTGDLEAANKYGWEPLIKRLDEIQRSLADRDRETAKEIGSLRGTIETFMEEHGRH